MELIERYLQAIGQYLPAESRNDILAELRSELLEQMDTRAEEWGRPLDEADVAALLRVHGRPAAVALRYLPQRSLIGPEIFPFYVLTLRRSLPLVLLLAAVANGVSFAVSPDVGHLAERVSRAIFGLIPTLFMFWGVVTMVFVMLDWARTKPMGRARLEQWDPSKLPVVKVQPVMKKSFNIRVVELAVHVLWMIYVLLIPAHPFLILGPGAKLMQSAGIGIAPVWHQIFVLVIVMLSVQLVQRLAALREGTQGLVKGLDFFSNAIGIAGLWMLAFAGQTLVATNTGVNAQKLQSLNYTIGMGFRLVLLLSVIGLVMEIWKYVRGRVRVPRQVAV